MASKTCPKNKSNYNQSKNKKNDDGLVTEVVIAKQGLQGIAPVEEGEALLKIGYFFRCLLRPE